MLHIFLYIKDGETVGYLRVRSDQTEHLMPAHFDYIVEYTKATNVQRARFSVLCLVGAKHDDIQEAYN